MYQKVASPGDRILQALKDAGMTRSELAERIGVNKASITGWIAGRWEPKQTALYNMGRVLGVSEMWLAGYDIPRERPPEQVQNDTLADIVARYRADDAYRSLIEKTRNLTGTQVGLISGIIDQMQSGQE